MIFSTLFNGLFVDGIHYIAQFIWVVGNLTWAAGEVFAPYDGAYDNAISFQEGLRHHHIKTKHEVDDPSISVTYDDISTWDYAHKSPRWFACWLFVFALFPIFVLYFVLVPWAIISGRPMENSPIRIAAISLKQRRLSSGVISSRATSHHAIPIAEETTSDRRNFGAELSTLNRNLPRDSCFQEGEEELAHRESTQPGTALTALSDLTFLTGGVIASSLSLGGGGQSKD